MTTPATINKAAFRLPVVGLLGAILVVLKVLGYSQLSWFWTLAPFWIPAVIGLVIFGIGTIVILAIAYFEQ